MTLTSLLRNAELLRAAMERNTFLKVALMDDRESIIQKQREQLLEGKDNDGNDMRPYYSEDLQPEGWFKSRESAMRYAIWKKTGISYPVEVNRNPDAPNLYIDGKFHSELEVQFGDKTVGVFPATTYAAGIVGKYGMNKFGLSSARWREVLDECRDRILRFMKEELYD